MAILDEIDSGLDIDAVRDVAKAVNALKRPDSGVLMVTHYKVRLMLRFMGKMVPRWVYLLASVHNRGHLYLVSYPVICTFPSASLALCRGFWTISSQTSFILCNRGRSSRRGT